MRKKWDNPAPLTMNLAFDTRLLDLIGEKDESEKPQPNRPKRYKSTTVFSTPSSPIVKKLTKASNVNYSK